MILSSGVIPGYLQATALAHKGELLAIGATAANTIKHSPYYDLVDSSGATVTGTNYNDKSSPNESDLHLMFGHVGLEGMQVSFEVGRTANNDIFSLICHVKGKQTDLEDFQYGSSDAPATPAAAVEAGFPTLGNSGNVYLDEVNFDTDVVSSHGTFISNP